MQQPVNNSGGFRVGGIECRRAHVIAVRRISNRGPANETNQLKFVETTLTNDDKGPGCLVIIRNELAGSVCVDVKASKVEGVTNLNVCQRLAG